MSVADGLRVNELEVEHRVYVALVVRVVLSVFAEMVNVGIFKVFLLRDGEHLVAIVLGEELTLPG